MDDQSIVHLKEALQLSPDNVPLRLHLADTLLRLERFDEAEAEYQEVIRRSEGKEGKPGLAHLYYEKGEFGTCNVILEELLDH
ncbi:MAG: tetratricopeptide repeat protein, partial [Bacteroidota bacterium]